MPSAGAIPHWGKGTGSGGSPTRTSHPNLRACLAWKKVVLVIPRDFASEGRSPKPLQHPQLARARALVVLPKISPWKSTNLNAPIPRQIRQPSDPRQSRRQGTLQDRKRRRNLIEDVANFTALQMVSAKKHVPIVKKRTFNLVPLPGRRCHAGGIAPPHPSCRRDDEATG